MRCYRGTNCGCQNCDNGVACHDCNDWISCKKCPAKLRGQMKTGLFRWKYLVTLLAEAAFLLMFLYMVIEKIQGWMIP